MKSNDNLPIMVHGHLTITDDLGNVLLDKDNAVHPQNMARVFARALANESNYFVKHMAFGRGGTTVDVALNVDFNPANDGLSPDTRTWDSTLYDETYREIVDDDDSNPPIGSGVVSNELGVISQVVITAFLSPGEPTGQILSSTDPENQNLDGTFTFDEIALYTGGAPQQPTAGIQEIDVGLAASRDSDSTITNLTAGTYAFDITVDGGTPITIEVAVPSFEPTYGELCEGINTGAWLIGAGSLPGSATIAITDTSGSYPSILGAQTFGFLRVTSGTSGAGSSILLEPPTGSPGTNLLTAMNNGTSTVLAAEDGTAAGVQNDPVNPDTEAERLLTHVVFSPIQKTADRSLEIVYTLTIAVARSQ